MDDRYSRQVLFKGVGPEGQQRLAQARVVIVGCGATGSALASLLARSGVGTLRILDRDYVEPSTCSGKRYSARKNARESVPKAIAAARQIARLTRRLSSSPMSPIWFRLTSMPCSRLRPHLDGTDNFETRYLVMTMP